MANEIVTKMELIVRQKRENNDDSNKQAHLSQITLQDVFQSVKKRIRFSLGSNDKGCIIHANIRQLRAEFQLSEAPAV